MTDTLPPRLMTRPISALSLYDAMKSRAEEIDRTLRAVPDMQVELRQLNAMIAAYNATPAE